MNSVLEQLSPGARVAIIRLRSLGDCVLTTPALRLLKAHRSDLEIALVVEDRFRSVFEGNPDVSILAPRMSDLVRFHPQLCLNLHGGTRSLALALGSGAPLRAGFGHFRAACMYNVRIPRAQEILGEERKVHTAEHLASAMFYLGVPRAGIPRASLYTDRAPAPRRSYAVLHPFASAPAKTWPPEAFAELARRLLAGGTDAVFIGAPSDQFVPFSEFTTLAGAPLATIKQWLAGASLFIGNDSGPAHMAAALGLPLVVLFGESDPDIWGPWRAHAEVIAAGASLAKVPVSDVLEAIERLRVAP
jgi:ADP-heptose:LPS heptosyltransferase